MARMVPTTPIMPLPPAIAAQEEGKIAEHGYGTGKRCDDGHGQCVAVLDVRQLVRYHACDFFRRQGY